MTTVLALKVGRRSGAVAPRALERRISSWSSVAIIAAALHAFEMFACAQGSIASELEPPITTEEFERLIVQALVTPSGALPGSSPPIANDPLALVMGRQQRRLNRD